MLLQTVRFFYLFCIHMDMKILIPKIRGGQLFVVLEKFHEFVFVVKAALQGDLLDRMIGVDQERFDVLHALFYNCSFGVVAEFPTQKSGEMVGTVAKTVCNFGNGEGRVGMNANKFRNLMCGFISVFVGDFTFQKELREDQFRQLWIAFLQMHQLLKDVDRVWNRGELFERCDRVNVACIKMKPIKRGVSNADFGSAVLFSRIQQKQISFFEMIVGFFLTQEDLSRNHEDQFEAVDGHGRMDPLAVGIEEPHIGKIQSCLINTQHVGFSHLILCFFIAFVKLLYYNKSGKSIISIKKGVSI